MRALIDGITGQDAAYLAQFLLNKGYEVYGTYRRLSTPNFWRLQALDIFDKINLIPMELIDDSSISEAIRLANPDEYYHLASMSFVGASFEQPIGTSEITGLGTARILESIRQIAPAIKFYNAASSEMYGEEIGGSQNEDTPFSPASPYAAAKLYSYNMTKIYRRGYGLFAVSGILMNHESPLRGMEFVTRKITNAVAKIKLGLADYLELGNLDTKRDWGYAPDYIEAMWAMLQLDKPQEFVIATGECHSVREFCSQAFGELGLDYKRYIRQSQMFMRPCEVFYHKGDATLAKDILGWQPNVRFDELVHIMVLADYQRWQDYLAGKRFAWDAPCYPNESRLLTKMARLER